MKKLSLSTTLAALLLAAVSCSNDEPEIPIEEPKIGAPAEVTVDSKAGTGKIAYTIANPVEGARIEAENDGRMDRHSGLHGRRRDTFYGGGQ